MKYNKNNRIRVKQQEIIVHLNEISIFFGRNHEMTYICSLFFIK